MAFIREYAAAGDPFRFRWPKRFKPPRFIRKFQPGKAALRAARMSVGFIPGVGSIADQLLPQFAGDVDDDDDSFERGYGLEYGDPGPRIPKRKGAASGPRHKAARKNANRKAKAKGQKRGVSSRGRGQRAARIRGAGGGIGGALARGLGGAVQFAGQLVPAFQAARGLVGGPAEQLALEDPSGAMLQEAVAAGQLSPSQATAAMRRARGIGVGRRTMNPANVKALRRSMRRVEGFGNLARRVLPTLGLTVTRSGSGARSSGKRKGHRPGCACVGCRKR